MRAFFIFLVLLLWALLGWCYWQDWNRCCATAAVGVEEGRTNGGDDSAAIVATGDGAEADATAMITGPLLFRWSDKAPVLGDGWDSLRNAWISGLNDSQILQIIGKYRSDETNNTSFENLGLARADSVRRLFLSDMPNDRIRLLGQLVDDGVDRNGPFESMEFRYGKDAEKIVEVADRTMIYFPYNSTNKLNDAEVEAYLDKVAERIKASGERVRLTGHTDNIGPTDGNLKLGQQRADIIKNYLMSRGVPAGQIVSESKGESQPVATNATREGRAQNRRMELQIIQ